MSAGEALQDAPQPVPGPPPAEGTGVVSGLFGRGLLYVVVASIQFLTATVVSPVLAYQLGTRGLGLMSSALALHQVLLVVAMVGLDQAMVLQRAEDGHDRSVRGLITVGASTALLLTAVVGATAPLWARAVGFDGFDSLVLATVLWTTPAAIIQLVLALLNAQDRLSAYTVVSCVGTVGSQAVGLVLVFTVRASPEVYAWGGVVGCVTAAAVGIALTRPTLPRLRGNPVVARSLRIGAPLMLSGVSVFVLNAGDRLVVQRMLGASEAGRYQVAYTVGYIAITVLSLTGGAWAARLTDVRDDTERWHVIGRSRDELYGLLAPMVVGISLAAPVALRVVAPASFHPSSLLLVTVVVVMSGVPVVSVLATSRALVSVRRTRPLAASSALAAVLNIGLNIALVPVWGLDGSAVATVVAIGVEALLQRLWLPARPAWPRTPTPVLLVLALACAVSLASVFLPQDVVWMSIRFAVALACLPWFLVRLRRAR